MVTEAMMLLNQEPVPRNRGSLLGLADGGLAYIERQEASRTFQYLRLFCCGLTGLSVILFVQ